jgi:hypothetical protein
MYPDRESRDEYMERMLGRESSPSDIYISASSEGSSFSGISFLWSSFSILPVQDKKNSVNKIKDTRPND